MTIINGKSIKEEILNELKEKVAKLGIKPSFVVLQIGNDDGSSIYIRQKEKMATYLGYEFRTLKLDSNVSLEDILIEIDKLNKDDTVNGIMVELPLPSGIDLNKVRNAIDPRKDIDGLNNDNLAKIFGNEIMFLPSTVYAIMEIFKRYNIDLMGKDIVIIGKSVLIGKPLSIVLMNEGASVSVCNSKTKDLLSYIKRADILISATGVANLITDEMIHDGMVIIDAGISIVDGKVCGDVSINKDKDILISPVPNGVGQVTTAMLAKNILKAYNLQMGEINE